MKIRKFLQLFNTIRYLKLTQVYYRLFYSVRERLRQNGYTIHTSSSHLPIVLLTLEKPIFSYISLQKNQFTFLNKIHIFNKKIDWNYSRYGKLWTYNLTYFDYLNQREISKKDGLRLINDFICQSERIKDGFMPFPISLRGVNWIKFLTKHRVLDQKINNSLYAQYFILMDNLEYHILGNHLLENGFSLLFGAYYFQDEKFYIKAKKILISELEEQILEDGAHFELSPMYHQLMLFRVLDCINLVKNNSWKNHELLTLLISKAEAMLGWLNIMTFENGNIPLFNDSTNKIAPTTKELNDYAGTLDIGNCYRLPIAGYQLSDSGYRKMKNEKYEMVVDVGNIGPDYIPGHAHSDTFNFELYIHNQPIIVDTGLSTYEPNGRRQLERSTRSHNTVEVDGKDQSEVWGGFRVARRAKITDIREHGNCIEATHNGYRSKGVYHTRKFIAEKGLIIIKDSIKSNSMHSCAAYLHFYPEVKFNVESKKLISKLFTITCINSYQIEVCDYDYSPEFNTKINAKCVKISFQNELKIEIKVKDTHENN